MKNILFIAYYYPPRGGAGVQRTLKFTKYLARKGYNVYVITPNLLADELNDDSLEGDLENNIHIYKTKTGGKFLYKLKKLFKKNSNYIKSHTIIQDREKVDKNLKHKIGIIVKRLFYFINEYYSIPDDKKNWIKYAVRDGEEIIKDKKIDIIFTTSAPYSAHLIGYKLARKTSVKWIADFRDAWASNPFTNRKQKPGIKLLNQYLENKVIKRADKIISVSRPIIDDLIRSNRKSERKFCVITNGYDEEDFKYKNINNGENKDIFSILYNGTLYGNRSPKLILESVSRLIENKKIQREKIKIIFLGQIFDGPKDVLERFVQLYPDVVEHKSYVTHQESIKVLNQANALLLLIDDGPGSEGIYTGKIFEYIRSGKPILGAIPDGVAKDLIVETRTGYFAHPSNQIEIENMIYKAYSNHFNYRDEFYPVWSAIAKYSREELTNKLIAVIEEIF